MTVTIPEGIWPPHEAFYLEAMLHCTSSALRMVGDVRQALENGSRLLPSSVEWRQCAATIIDGVQTIASESAAVSRYFWPTRQRELHASRAARLRASLGVTEDSPLRNRELRNRLEHFDEKLDEFCRSVIAGVILPTYGGPMPAEPEGPTHLFRAYYTDVAVFEVLGSRFEIQPLVDEMITLHDRLVECSGSGWRIC